MKNIEPKHGVIYTFVYEDGQMRSFKYLSNKAGTKTPTYIMANVTNSKVEYTDMTASRFSFLYKKQLVSERLERDGKYQLTEKEFEERFIDNSEPILSAEKEKEMDERIIGWLTTAPFDEKRVRALIGETSTELAKDYQKGLKGELDDSAAAEVYSKLFLLEREFGGPYDTNN